jgi:hypothetical protein
MDVGVHVSSDVTRQYYVSKSRDGAARNTKRSWGVCQHACSSRCLDILHQHLSPPADGRFDLCCHPPGS